MKHLLTTLLLFSFWGCKEKATEVDTDHTEQIVKEDVVIFGGSETEMDMIQELLNAYNDPLFKYVIKGGGSRSGLKQLEHEEITVANSSIPMSKSKLKKLNNDGQAVKEVIIALDAVAIITNAKLGVDSLNIFDLQKIYTGKITNWDEVGGPNLDITLYGRDENSGTNDFFWKKIVQEDYATGLNVVQDNDEMIKSIQLDKSGIGYVGIGNIIDKNGKPSDDVWAINIYIEGGESHSPFEGSAIKSADYFLTRPLYQYIHQKDMERLKSFIEFELSEQGQEIIEKFGFFPITENFSIKNQQQGFGTIEEL